MQRRLHRWLGIASAAALTTLLFAGIAAAHTTTVVSSSPADGATVAGSPSQVTAQFSEELDTQRSTMQVFDATGKQVSEGNGKVDLNDADHKTMIAPLPAALPGGLYAVKWHVYLTDGDDTSGQFGFAVPAPAAQSTVAPTSGPTVAPTAAVTAEPTATAAASPTAAPTGAATAATTVQGLPGTGGDQSRVTWMVLAGIAILVVGALLVGVRSKSR